MEFVEDGNKAADDEDDDDGCSDELAAANVFLFLDELSLNPKEEELLASFILLLDLAFRLENSVVVVVVVEAVVGLGIVGQQEYKFLLEFEWSTKSIQLLLPLVVVVAVVGGGLLTKVCSLLEFD